MGEHKIQLFPAVFVLCIVAVQILSLSGNCSAQASGSNSPRPETIEWTWAVRPAQPDARLPNVLLVGDSISRNYFPEVTRELTDIANVYLYSCSTSVGDPRLPRQLGEFAAMEAVSFRVVHFNNGMHGWSYSEDDYRKAFPTFLASIQSLTPGASLIWATTTPVKTDKPSEETNERVDTRNAIAQRFITAASIPTDDQHALMMKHLDSFQDNVHFNIAGANIQGEQAAKFIQSKLE